MDNSQSEAILIDVKSQYNKILQAHFKATEYLDNNNITLSEREKHLPRYKEIKSKLSALLDEITRQGVFYTQNEALYGFKTREENDL